MKEVFFKNEEFLYGSCQERQGGKDDPADPQEQGGQKVGAGPPQGAEGQEVEQGPQGQDQGHEKAQAALPHGEAQEEEGEGGQEAEEQIQGQAELIQLEAPSQGGQEVVDQAQAGAAGQGNQGLQPLPSGIETHQPSSLPNQPRRAGAFSA